MSAVAATMAFGWASGAVAQVQVRITGDVEYQIGYDRTRTGGETSSSTYEWAVRASPTMDGFVLSPRFLTFSLSSGYRRDDTQFLRDETLVTQFEPYRLRLDLFPQSAHSFEIRASRTETDRSFASSTALLTSAINEVREEEALTWRYRGTARWPEASVELRREQIDEDTTLGDFGRTLYTLEVRARKALARSIPQLTYTLEHLDDRGPLPVFRSAVTRAEGFTQRLQYDDQIRVGDRSLLTPLVFWRLNPDGSQSANAGARLTSPLSPTLDANAGARYSYDDFGDAPATHTLAADGVLTKRLSPTFTLTGGANGVAVRADTLTWSGGVFGGLSAMPWPSLTISADGGAQVIGDDRGLGHLLRGHVGAVSTYLPRHTLSADYFATLSDPSGDQPVFVSHDASLVLTSLLLPSTTMTAGYNLSVQDGLGTQWRHSGRMEATVMPIPWITVRGATDGYRRTESGGGRGETSEVGWGIDGGVTVAPARWFSLNVFGRRAVQDTEHEDERTRFVSEIVRGSATALLGRWELTAEGFMEREPILELTRRGIRGSVSYRYRVWRFALDAEASQFSTAGVDGDRLRVFFRIGRTMNTLLRF